MMSVIGFGSLLSETSSRFTFPDLENFRVARLRGFRRVFAHVTPFFLSACAPTIQISPIPLAGLIDVVIISNLAGFTVMVSASSCARMRLGCSDEETSWMGDCAEVSVQTPRR